MRRAFVGLLSLALAGCASLPKARTITPSYVLADTSETLLGRVAARAIGELQGTSGVHLMARGPDAFLARLALVAAAERSIDAQYYIWHNDTTGRLLASAVLRAADRGVRVRLLIDDVGSSPNDDDLLLLDGHPNVEVRLFNPIASRSTRDARHGRGLLAHQPAHAQQDHHRRQPDGDRGRAQHRRRVLRGHPELDFGDLDALTVGAG